MLKGLDRHIDAASRRIVFLAPNASTAAQFFSNTTLEQSRYGELLREVQKFRGGIYLKDGALRIHQLTADGLHRTEEDENSWHMLLLDREGRVGACALYREHEPNVTFDELRVRHCAMAHDAENRPRLIAAIQAELDRARAENLRYVELGGWAVSEEIRGTAGSIALALAVYAFSRRDLGALGLTTATFRHCSATILKRLGGARFEVDGQTLPPYFDPKYQCLMELLRFDSRKPNSKFVGLIDLMRETLHNIRVVAKPAAATPLGVVGRSVLGAHALAS